MIVGTIGSYLIAGQGGTFSVSVFLIYEIVVIIGGMLFIGFSEVIKLLQEIRDRL